MKPELGSVSALSSESCSRQYSGGNWREDGEWRAREEGEEMRRPKERAPIRAFLVQLGMNGGLEVGDCGIGIGIGIGKSGGEVLLSNLILFFFFSED